GVDGEEGLLLVQVRRQRHLHEIRVDRGILVVAPYDPEELLLGRRRRQLRVHGLDADLRGILTLEPHVGVARRVVTDEHGAEPGGDAVLGEPFDAHPEVVLDGVEERLPVEQCGGHHCWKCRSPVNTIARPSSSARSMIFSSRIPPPGWITAATPAAAAASMPSSKG